MMCKMSFLPLARRRTRDTETGSGFPGDSNELLELEKELYYCVINQQTKPVKKHMTKFSLSISVPQVHSLRLI